MDCPNDCSTSNCLNCHLGRHLDGEPDIYGSTEGLYNPDKYRLRTPTSGYYEGRQLIMFHNTRIVFPTSDRFGNKMLYDAKHAHNFLKEYL